MGRRIGNDIMGLPIEKFIPSLLIFFSFPYHATTTSLLDKMIWIKCVCVCVFVQSSHMEAPLMINEGKIEADLTIHER